MKDNCSIWRIHAEAKMDGIFMHDSIVAIGFSKFTDPTKLKASKEEFIKKYAESYPNASKASVSACASTIYRFVHEVQLGDYVVFPSKSDRMVNIGIIEGECAYNPSSDYPIQRKVKWLKHLPRTLFSNAALAEIGSFLSFFTIKNYSDEFIEALSKNFKKQKISFDEDMEELSISTQMAMERTKDFILKKLSRCLKGYDFQDIITNLLTAMGYMAIPSQRGGDRGIDITAYKDEFPPRILVQVKSQDSQINEALVQSLKGAMKEGDYGLFFTLSDYTKNARIYLEHTPIIRGINGIELVDLLLKYYDKLDEKYRKIIPLKMIYVPDTGSDQQ